MTHPRMQFAARLSVVAAVSTLVLKFTAYGLTGSVGLLSDAAESLINLAAALTANFALWYASRPLDREHTYGHEKIEFFSSGLEGILVLVAAAGIGWYAVERLLTPRELTTLDLGLGLGLVASAINLAVAQVLLRVGKATGSIVLEADGQHLMTDVWTSVAVLAGLALVWLTHLTWLDPVIALGVTVSIVWTGYDLIRRSFNGLMDHALPLAEQAVVRAAVEKHLQPGMAFHALRTRQAGTKRFVDFHLLVPGVFTVRRAHQISEQIEEAIRAGLPGSEVTVHIEPIEDRSAWDDSDLFKWE